LDVTIALSRAQCQYEEIEKQDHYLSIATYRYFARDAHNAMFIRTRNFGY
jgi:hypothetical protein